MNVPVTCRGGLYPPSHQLRLLIEHKQESEGETDELAVNIISID
jgi:hypothetical protein